MRLLNAKTLKLHSFQEGEAPRYAILSHTWHDEEVLFEDLQDISRASKRAGFAKIQFCCGQALKEDIEFVWVDTCCIDKTSSAELSEAINSMYRWYQNARICYAYLRDVLMPEDGEVDIRGSLWFQRAWTLQELLAPRQLVFFSSDWKVVGSKEEKISTIAEATGIDDDYLIYGQLNMASIAKRMSWAANRKATRAEDIAYSLFGIFDVQMPLLYGEGLPKAFRRLQEEIMKYSDDHTLFAWGERYTNPNKIAMYWDETTTPGKLDILKSHNSSSDTSRHIPENCAVLAQSPADFIRSHNLVPFRFKEGQARPYSMTNIGLHISLPLNIRLEPRVLQKVTSGVSKVSKYFFGTLSSDLGPQSVRVFAVLNCHAEGDFFHALALPLVRVGPMHFVRDLKRRLQLLQTAHISAHIVQEVFIENKHIERYSFGRRNRHLGFILPEVSAQKVLNVYPPGFWDAKAGILQGLEHGGQRKSWHACLELKVRDSRGSERKLLLILGLNIRSQSEGHRKRFNKSGSCAWDDDYTVAEPLGILLDFNGTRTLEQLYQKGLRMNSNERRFYSSFKHHGVYIRFNPHHIDFGLTNKEDIGPAFVDIMGEYMSVVDIDTK